MCNCNKRGQILNQALGARTPSQAAQRVGVVARSMATDTVRAAAAAAARLRRR